MKNFDLTTVYNKDRPMSWSAISAFEWRPSDWYLKYVIHGKCLRGKITPEKVSIDFCVVVGYSDPECPVVKKTPELEFGSMVDQKIQDDPTYLPALVRYPILQHEMTGTFTKIPLLGYADTFLLPQYKIMPRGVTTTRYAAIRDYKTGRKPWDQQRADETGQLTMYLFMLYLRDKIKPEDVECYIDWLPTHIEDGKIAFIKEGEIITFKTQRTMTQLLQFGTRIARTWSAMEEYATQQQEMDADDFFAHVDK